MVSLVLFMVTFSEATTTGASRAGDVGGKLEKVGVRVKNA